MDFMQFVTGVLGIGLAVMGWFARELWDSVKQLKESLDVLRNDVSQFYVRKDDFKEFRSEILGVLQRIENKLDTKQDK